MSIQPICKRPELLQKFSYKEFDSKFFKYVKKLAKKHNDFDSAVPCYLSLQENFADAENKFFLVFGKFSKWKIYAKQKAQTSPALYGICYITTEEDGNAFIINVIPIKGKIKTKAIHISKALKGLISPSRCKIELIEMNITEEAYENIEAKTEAMEDMDENESEENENIVAEAQQGNIPNPATNNSNTPVENHIESNDNNAQVNTEEAQKLTAAQAKKIETMRADISELKALLQEIQKCETKAELKALDEAIRAKFAPYGAKKSS